MTALLVLGQLMTAAKTKVIGYLHTCKHKLVLTPMLHICAYILISMCLDIGTGIVLPSRQAGSSLCCASDLLTTTLLIV